MPAKNHTDFQIITDHPQKGSSTNEHLEFFFQIRNEYLSRIDLLLFLIKVTCTLYIVQVDFYGYTALHAACEAGHADLIVPLLGEDQSF